MYNGIGLPTPRGSGTNGYVQKNLAHVSKKRQMKPDIVSPPDPDIDKTTDPEIVLHQKKREIESKCLRLRRELEEEGWKHADIEEEINAYRTRKLKELTG
jgi:serine/arginine repetitive matrix protein 2